MHKTGVGKTRANTAWWIALALSWCAIVPARAQGLPAAAPEIESSTPSSSASSEEGGGVTSGPQLEAAPASTSSEPTAKQLAEARRLFARGVEYAREHSYSRAASKFEEALAIHRAPAIEYNLASALYELGRFDESYSAVTHVLAAADVSLDVRARAQQLARTLTERTARLTVLIGGNAPGVAVRVDGVPWAPSQVGVTHAVAPGRHVIEATSNGHVLSRRDIQIPLRTAALIDLTLIPCGGQSSLTEAGGPQPLAAGQSDRHARNLLRNGWLWGGVAAVLVAGGVTAAILLARDHGPTPKASTGMAQPALFTWR